MKSRAVILVVALCALLGAGVFSWWKVRAEDAPGPAVPPSAVPVAQGVQSRAMSPGVPGAAAAASAVPDAPLPPLPGSLKDTEEDGAVLVDASGHLVPNADLRRFFNYYLSATGEEPASLIRERILTALRAKKLPAAAMDEAVQVLDDYLAYLDAARGLASKGSAAMPDTAERLESLRKLRREHLGPGVADGLFGQEEAVDAVAVERLKLMKDASLTKEEREQRMAALEERLPPEVRASREEAVRPLRQQAVEQELLAAGATAEDLHQHRLSTVGPEATERLEALDAERAQWKQRLADFRAKRAALGQSEPNPARRQAAVQRLLFDSFTPEERLRVEAADSIEAASGSPGAGGG
ncbi:MULTISPECIES: lipase secretion chaperone [unclassified Corallococcus]|uniref:lipase secretion chaperone n=1 Tax=unclassified Corallococcus TaxID=2685029 RepID=UPI001A8D3FC3|nr:MULTISPECIES: lipase secretion chaperone [unclassified Corallococcus]MBN9684116.1 lipase chaperone [Corallococcus sp. NCSPR001]WAS84393.1 lipase secretion chaperone [Corallococcus sp. NCRR]